MKVNLKSIKSRRTISVGELRQVCIDNDYYTCGDNEAYDKMLSKVATQYYFNKPGHFIPELTDDLLQELAIDIFNHSDIDEILMNYGCSPDDVLCSILFKIVDASHTLFEVSAEYEEE